MKDWLVKNNKTLKIIGITLIILSLPLVLILVKQNQDSRSSAAAADKLETEGGTLSSAGISKQNDTTASGGQFVLFSNLTNTPTPTKTPTPTPSGNVINVPTSIDSTGATDVSTALKTLIRNAPNGSTIVFRAGGRYRIERALLVAGKNGITFAGNGATIVLPSQDHGFDSQGFQVSNSVGTTIRDFTMVGNHNAPPKDTFKTRANNHAIAVLSADDTLIERMNISATWGACLYVRHYAEQFGDWSDGVIFRDSRCVRTGNAGISMKGAKDVLIERNVFDQMGYSGMNIETGNPHEGADGVIYRNNTVSNYAQTDSFRGYLLSSCDSPWNEGSSVRNVTVTGNTVAAGSRRGKDGALLGLHVMICGSNVAIRENFVIRDNVALGAVAGPVMQFEGVKGVTVTGNRQPLSSGSLVSSPGSTNVVISGNVTN